MRSTTGMRRFGADCLGRLGPLTVDDAWRALRQSVPDLGRDLEDQRLEIFDGRDWYLQHGAFDMTRVKQLERRNIVDALEQANWKVYGPGGAADTLGLKASTLASRIKALKIERPHDGR